MKFSRSSVRSQAHAIPEIRFEQGERAMTSFGGLVVFQALFASLGLREQLRGCFRHLQSRASFGPVHVFLVLIVHRLLGYRELRDSRFYAEDPLVQRIVGLDMIPSVSTMTRQLGNWDADVIERLRESGRNQVIESLCREGVARVTLDFDGTRQGTNRMAEGTAVGYNPKKKGQRSYYPLFCTVAQTAQVLDFHHRPGNAHDSRDAVSFIEQCVGAVREGLDRAPVMEARMDGAFYSDEVAQALHGNGVGFTISVPFERLAGLKHIIESRRRWHRAADDLEYFETWWKPQNWSSAFRIVVVRQRVRKRRRGEVQFEMFLPQEEGYEFKAIVTNRTTTAKDVVRFHEGRGSQERVFGEMKTDMGLEYVPSRRRIVNQAYLLAGVFAHNLGRELQMRTEPRQRATTAARAAHWAFQSLSMLRKRLIQRAGRLTRPQNRFRLTIAGDSAVAEAITHALRRLGAVC